MSRKNFFTEKCWKEKKIRQKKNGKTQKNKDRKTEINKY
jgi:hypothetical protein